MGARVRRGERLLGAGGRLAIPLSDPDAAFGGTSIVALNWVAVVLEAGLGLGALATVQSWARVIPAGCS